MKLLPLECWRSRFVQRPVQRGSQAASYFRSRRGLHRFRRDEVEHSQLIVRSEKSPGVAWRPGFVPGQLIEAREPGWRRV